VDTLLFGRKTYQLMASYCPTEDAIRSDPQVAGLMNRLPKVVFSQTLESAAWNNTRLIRENAQDEVRKLKNQPGGDMAIFGSANLMSSLMEVIDEHRVMVNPVLLKQGIPVFPNTGAPLRLELVDTRPFQSGNVLLTYRPLQEEK
jgi:dihydrofolate reductase